MRTSARCKILRHSRCWKKMLGYGFGSRGIHQFMAICSMYGIFTSSYPKNDPVMLVNIPYMEHMMLHQWNDLPGCAAWMIFWWPTNPTEGMLGTCDAFGHWSYIYILKIAIYSGFTHEKWWFSIAMLDYQRVSLDIYWTETGFPQWKP